MNQPNIQYQPVPHDGGQPDQSQSQTLLYSVTATPVPPPSHSQSPYQNTSSNPPVYQTPDPDGKTLASARGPVMKGKWKDIGVSFCFLTIPMIALNLGLALLLILHLETGSADLTKREKALFANINATTFTTVASWSQTVAPLLGGFMVMLASYPAAALMACQAGRGRQPAGDDMPTPYQLALMIEVKAGAGLGTLKRFLRYKFGKNKSTRPFSKIFNTFVGGMLLSLVVFATSTWLHVATTTVEIFRFSPSPGTNLSFALRENCVDLTQMRQSQTTPCNVVDPDGRLPFLTPSELEPLQVLSNISSKALIKLQPDPKESRSYAYVSPADTPTTLGQDYTARTFAISTTCEPATKECKVDEDGVGALMSFECPGDFEGELFSTPFALDYGTEARNPYEMRGVILRDRSTPWPFDDPDIVSTDRGYGAFAFKCETTAWDVQYEVENHTLVSFVATQANASTSAALNAVMVQTTVGRSKALDAFGVAGYSDTLQGVLDVWATEYSRVVAASGSSALLPSAADEATFRTAVLAARVPIAPLVALLAANMLFVLAGAWLGFVALRSSKVMGVKEAVERTNIIGMVAQALEGERGEKMVENPRQWFSDGAVEGYRKRVAVAMYGNTIKLNVS